MRIRSLTRYKYDDQHIKFDKIFCSLILDILSFTHIYVLSVVFKQLSISNDIPKWHIFNSSRRKKNEKKGIKELKETLCVNHIILIRIYSKNLT